MIHKSKIIVKINIVMNFINLFKKILSFINIYLIIKNGR
jgi:hypothetical protein